MGQEGGEERGEHSIDGMGHAQNCKYYYDSDLRFSIFQFRCDSIMTLCHYVIMLFNLIFQHTLPHNTIKSLFRKN